MPRLPRQHVPFGLYHAILRGNHRQTIFHGAPDCGRFETILGHALDRFGATVWAYCWMPNHVHLAIRIGEQPLGRIMHLVASRYARFKQKPVPTTGHLFERRYRAKLVATDEYLLALIRYIHLNPVRSALVATAEEYPWSSHRAYLGGRHPSWLALAEPLRAGGRAAYLDLMGREPTDAELAAVRLPRFRGRARLPADPAPLPLPAPAAPRKRSLDTLINEVAASARLDPVALASPDRSAVLVAARVAVVERALREGVATLSQVAARLNRSPSSLSELISRGGPRRL